MTKTTSTLTASLVAVVLAAAAGSAAAEGPIEFSPVPVAQASLTDRSTVVAQVLKARAAGSLTPDEAALNAWNLPATSTVSRVAVAREAAVANASGYIRARYGEIDLGSELPMLRSRGEVVASR